ncbi:TylF/MycF/NovP-related O-methyltransferase [Phreatobacter stygius]|uniref:Macrocin O-methyltransferase n=1 Tax=Phreatobacter stygius TaxID=1940610 RepID=A0A4D7B123_9HYPH|nr:TylF/MycF/NovP-related O-methyltransferase [Phreatobacter stygius]QCI63176.1 hypothetical protein E8M01_02335 [Phreatobacter stygius]
MTNTSSTSADDDRILHEVAALLSEGKPVPIDMEERSLRIHLRAHPTRSDLLQRLCAVLAEQGRLVPIDLEERALLALMELEPDRADLKERLRIVQVGLGKKPPPPPILGLAGEEASQTDVDFQSEAENYDQRSKFGDFDPDFAPILESARRYTMTSVERMYALYKAIEYIESAAIPGAIVECGVWRGGSIMVALAALKALGRTERDIYLFDTFEGLPQPDAAKDVDMFGNRAIDGWLPHSRGETQSNWAYASLDDVRANVARTGYPMERIHFVKGMVEDTLPAAAPESIALLRLDTDWYASTRHEMIHLFPRLCAGGVLIIDDYGHFLGARQAIDEYIAEQKVPLLLNRIDYSGRLGIKIASEERPVPSKWSWFLGRSGG